ncbi:hypothetical protein B1218_35895 [Pseudomonas ogarae]|nr:hypothetical protein B1218_35895 [Pseudomonas ogarae]
MGEQGVPCDGSEVLERRHKEGGGVEGGEWGKRDGKGRGIRVGERAQGVMGVSGRGNGNEQ